MDLAFRELEKEIQVYVGLWAKSDPRASALMPYPLYLHFEMERTGALLVSGGILEQPDWLWQLTTKAGIMYEILKEEALEELEFERLAEQSREQYVRDGINKKLQSTN